MTTFPYLTKIGRVELGTASLLIESLESLDATIDDYFREYERSGNDELFESLCPYFGVPWPAGVALAKYTLTRLSDFQGSVLELGCGLALPSLALAQSGHTSITASDFHPDVPAFLERNCRHNSAHVTYRQLDWQDAKSGADFLLGSDLVYDRRQPSVLCGFLQSNPWKEAVFADPGRPYWDQFLALARANWAVEEFLFDGIFFARLRAGRRDV